MTAAHQQKLWEAIVVRVVTSLLIIAVGLAGMALLAKMRKPPTQAEITETAIRVEVMTAESGDYPVTILGFGGVMPLNVSLLSCEVSGRVTEVNPRLEAGERLAEGDLIVRIDDRDYRAAHDEALATTKQLENTVNRLKLQLRYDKERLDLAERNLQLAKTEFERARKLLSESNVGSQVAVDAAERAFNTAATQAVSLRQSLETLPVRIAETEQNLVAAGARLARTEINLERCTVRAPFACRVKAASGELGQLASPTLPLATLVDDSVLELHVPVDSVDARKWLEFTADADADKPGWFGAPRPVACRVSWTEDLDGHAWTGTLHRVVDFSSDTRTLVLAVRVDRNSTATSGSLPLAEGMFCRVEIPGRQLRSVFRVPRQSVTYEQELYAARSNRLATVRVRVEYVDDSYSYISRGIDEGDRIVTTRLVDPLEGSLIDATPRKEATDS